MYWFLRARVDPLALAVIVAIVAMINWVLAVAPLDERRFNAMVEDRHRRTAVALDELLAPGQAPRSAMTR